MGLTIADSYYLKAKGAIDGYYSDWQEACEALNYALSYDQEHLASLCFLGEIYAKNLALPQMAFTYFDKVIALDMQYTPVYGIYINALIRDNKLDRAQKLIDFAMKIASADKAELYWLSSYINEVNNNPKASLTFVKLAIKHCCNDSQMYLLEDTQTRLKKKFNLKKKKTKKTKKKTKKQS